MTSKSDIDFTNDDIYDYILEKDDKRITHTLKNINTCCIGQYITATNVLILIILVILIFFVVYNKKWLLS